MDIQLKNISDENVINEISNLILKIVSDGNNLKIRINTNSDFDELTNEKINKISNTLKTKGREEVFENKTIDLTNMMQSLISSINNDKVNMRVNDNEESDILKEQHSVNSYYVLSDLIEKTNSNPLANFVNDQKIMI